MARHQHVCLENICHNLFNLDTMQLIDPGLPDWKGNVLKHLSTAQLNLARMDMEENRYYQPCFRDFTYQNV